LKERWKAKKDKKKDDLQTLKLKALSEKFDAPKRVEIKELELALRKLVEFKEIGNSKKRQICCREIAFVIQDLTMLYNMSHSGGPRITKEFMGYDTQEDENKIYGAKKTKFNYFNLKQKGKNPRYPVTDDLNNMEPTDPDYAEENYDAQNSEDHLSEGDHPMSEQEVDLHKIRDRIRLRLQLLDVNYRNLEGEIMTVQLDKSQAVKMDAILDGDVQGESEKERKKEDSEAHMTIVQRCIIQNRRLMFKQEQEGFKDKELETLANRKEALDNPDRWVNKIKVEKDANDQEVSAQMKDQNIVKYLTENQIQIPVFREPAEHQFEEREKQYQQEQGLCVSPVRRTVGVDPKVNWSAKQIARFKARTDVLNVIQVKMPTEKEKLVLKKPDLNKLINRGLLISANIGEDEEQEVYGHRLSRKHPPANSKLRTKKFNGKSLASVGF